MKWHRWLAASANVSGLLLGTPALGAEASLTLSTEVRLRYDAYTSGQLVRGNDYQQGLMRGVVGADLRVDSHWRVQADIATGQVDGRRGVAAANFQNEAALQQLFVDTNGTVGATVVGAMLGRQEFSDGPKQLVSVGDGPNVHRSWNGVRLYARGQQLRAGAFDLRATVQGRGAFDEDINQAERLQGINASAVLSSGDGPPSYLDPFWLHTENPGYRMGTRVGPDVRDTVGARLWGQRGDLQFDWTLARQTGQTLDRSVQAWGLFTVHSLALSHAGWKPHLTAHIDIASGGGSSAAGTTATGFNPLYASSNYLGEGQFMSLSNLVMVAPGLSVSPTLASKLAIEYGFARRMEAHDAVYAGGMRAYANTQNTSGHTIGGLLRIQASWAATRRWTLFGNYEQLAAGDVLQQAGLPCASYAYLGASFRY